MKKAHAFLASVVLTVSGFYAYNQVDFPAPGQVVGPVTIAPLAAAVEPADLGIQLNPISGLPTQVEAVQLSEAMLANTIESDCFEKFWLARALITDNSVNGTGGQSNLQVLQKLRAASGQIPVTVYHQPWYHPSSCIGYRNPGDTLIHVRDTTLTNACDTASLIAHEAIGHVLLGMTHDFYATAQRPFSVPYSINAGFTECCR